MDYKELKNIADNLVNEAGKIVELENEKKELEKANAKMIMYNFDRFFTPEYECWKEIISTLYKVVGSIDEVKLWLETEKSVISVDTGIYATGYWSIFHIGDCTENFYGLRSSLMSIMQDGIRSADHKTIIRHTLEHFGTEEKTMLTIEKYRNSIKNILDQYEEKIKNKNEALSGEIQKLKEMLDTSSVVEEKDDGSIELHFGGKTYIGNIKEV